MAPPRVMISIDVPGRGALELARLVLDVNGTIAEDGHLRPGVKERIARLSRQLEIVMVTADTYGRQVSIDRELDLEATRLEHGKAEAPQKAALVKKLGSTSTVAIGNGANDAEMLREAAIGICVLESEGTSVQALISADAVSRSITEALDLLLHPRRLVATLRQ
ncbi:MAG TPA: HAD family hydrolase [Chloroflexota bacterium]|nr:HAD family hydrolase [Chloroflexota bacterium]